MGEAMFVWGREYMGNSIFLSIFSVNLKLLSKILLKYRKENINLIP